MLNYYHVAKKASLEYKNHPFLCKLKSLAQKSEKILDNGCGEGSRLFTMAGNKISWGVDINENAIELAKRQYPNHIFKTVKPNRLPYKDNFFDLVYSAFVLEHTTEPQEYLKESFRVLKPGGKFVLIFPNFGSPNRRSPNSAENPLHKLFDGLINDFKSMQKTKWKYVIPKSTYNQIDDDTTVEPYITTVVNYISIYGEIETQSTLWELEPWSINPRKIIFKILGLMGLYPFVNWGPQGAVIATKK